MTGQEQYEARVRRIVELEAQRDALLDEEIGLEIENQLYRDGLMAEAVLAALDAHRQAARASCK